jgi:integrase
MAITKGTPYVLDAVEEYIRTKAAREPKTRAAYVGVLLGSERGTKKPLGRAFAPHFHNRRFGTLRPDEVVEWFNQRVAGGALVTKHRISKTARAFLRWARERGYTAIDLAGALPAFSSGGPRVDWLEWSQVHALIDAIPEFRYRFAAAWIFYTGCRVQEAVDALQRDVRWREETGLHQWTIPDSKTHRPRVVWLPEALDPYLAEARNANRARPDWPVLWDCRGRGFGRAEDPSSRISPRSINGALERARDAINLPIRVTAHIAKHSYCTNWIKAFGDGEIAMVKLSKQVGTSVSVLRATYVHITLSDADWAQLRAFGG